MSNEIDLNQFNQTPIVKKLKKSKSTEKLNELDKQESCLELTHKPVENTIPKAKPKSRGRKTKYENDEERKAARRQQQKEYRLRKKQELEKLKEMIKDNQ